MKRDLFQAVYGSNSWVPSFIVDQHILGQQAWKDATKRQKFKSRLIFYLLLLCLACILVNVGYRFCVLDIYYRVIGHEHPMFGYAGVPFIIIGIFLGVASFISMLEVLGNKHNRPGNADKIVMYDLKKLKLFLNGKLVVPDLQSLRSITEEELIKLMEWVAKTKAELGLKRASYTQEYFFGPQHELCERFRLTNPRWEYYQELGEKKLKENPSPDEEYVAVPQHS